MGDKSERNILPQWGECILCHKIFGPDMSNPIITQEMREHLHDLHLKAIKWEIYKEIVGKTDENG